MLAVKSQRGEGEDGRVYGKIMLVDGEVKINTNGKTRVVKVCKTKDERDGALKQYLGITLQEEERKGIRG